ncbi:MAG: FMN-dependent NADH-azoreductase, partial [Actinoplanes sp.]|nr:FMN-dependent NADH-azoreductase [Actinoplanes sp.]
MAHLLHIDSSITGERSVSRKLTARTRDVWRAAHPGGTVTYRDLGSSPVPHLDADTALARMVPPEQRTPAQAASWALTEQLVNEIKQADTILLGLPLYNFGAPSSVKAWVDHLIAPGLTIDPETKAGLLGGREFVVLASRGGGYGEGTPRHGWDHAQPWLPHAISHIGLEPHFIT